MEEIKWPGKFLRPFLMSGGHCIFFCKCPIPAATNLVMDRLFDPSSDLPGNPFYIQIRLLFFFIYLRKQPEVLRQYR